MRMKTGTETVAAVETKGLLDAADRILRELIRTPRFKETVIILLNSIDPPSARRLVRTLFWQDPGLLLSIMGSLPALINVVSEALAEVACQMKTMPPPLLQDFLDRVVAGIDGQSAGEAVGGLVSSALSLGVSEEGSGLRRSLAEVGSDFGRAYAEAAGGAALSERLGAWMAGAAERAQDPESAFHGFVQAAARAVRENPSFVENVLRPILEPVLGTPAKSKASAGGSSVKKAGGKE
ncbi:MAG: hypothetical protein QME88_05205 [Actinomycetota bacterium]|nr:hypothetical protein [Actinomycetota bacterium]